MSILKQDTSKNSEKSLNLKPWPRQSILTKTRFFEKSKISQKRKTHFELVPSLDNSMDDKISKLGSKNSVTPKKFHRTHRKSSPSKFIRNLKFMKRCIKIYF